MLILTYIMTSRSYMHNARLNLNFKKNKQGLLLFTFIHATIVVL